MDPPLLVAIGMLAFLVIAGVLLLDRKLTALQGDLGRLDDIEALTRRVHELAGELDRKEYNAALQAKVTEFTEADRRLQSAVAEMQQELCELRRVLDRPVETLAEPTSWAPDVAAIVREHLLDEGFDRVHILSDLNQLKGLSGRVVFEAHRHGVMHKGHVGLADGAVIDENVLAAYSAFP